MKTTVKSCQETKKCNLNTWGKISYCLGDSAFMSAGLSQISMQILYNSSQNLNIEVKKPSLNCIWKKQRANAKIFLKKKRLEEFVFSLTVSLLRMNIQVVNFQR